jgi:mannitol/fructose-specific phosphotransferase system IIA component (Ntr-type)
MPLIDLFPCTAVLEGPALAKAELITRLLTLLAQAGHIEQADVLGIQLAILLRERLGSTGIGRGVAIPHLKDPAVTRPLGVLAVCRPPLWFDAIDGDPVDIVALCLCPIDQPGQKVGMLSLWGEALFRRLADEEFCRQLRQVRSAEEIEDLLSACDGGMTRQQWLTCTNPREMMLVLESCGRLTERKARLLGVAVCRCIWDLLDDPRSWQAVEVAERFADGLASVQELEAAHAATEARFREAPALYWATEVRAAASRVSGETIREVIAIARGTDARAMAMAFHGDLNSEVFDAERAAQGDLLRDIFGFGPFRSPCIDPRWRTPLVRLLARAAYDERIALDPSRPGWLTLDPDRLLVLSDALEEAGCTDAQILGHLRGTGPHVRGCWCVDSLLDVE